MNVESAEALVQELTSKLEHQLKSVDVENIREYVEAGEWGVGYELLCAQLDEYGIQIDAEVFSSLCKLGKFGRFDPSVWSDLSLR